MIMTKLKRAQLNLELAKLRLKRLQKVSKKKVTTKTKKKKKRRLSVKKEQPVFMHGVTDENFSDGSSLIDFSL